MVSERLRELVEAQAGAVSDLASEFEASAMELGQAAHAANLTFERAEELLGAPTTDSLFLDARATMANLKDSLRRAECGDPGRPGNDREGGLDLRPAGSDDGSGGGRGGGPWDAHERHDSW